MDIFCEYMVKKKKTAMDKLMTVGWIAAAAFLSLLIVLFLFGRVYGFEVFLIAGVWYGAIFLIRKTNIEYEYILTNSIMDIDKIMSQKTRKRIVSIDFKQIEACGPIKNMRSANPAAKVFNLSAGDGSDSTYYVDFSKNGAPCRVMFSPNEKIIQNLKTINPRMVSIREE